MRPWSHARNYWGHIGNGAGLHLSSGMLPQAHRPSSTMALPRKASCISMRSFWDRRHDNLAYPGDG